MAFAPAILGPLSTALTIGSTVVGVAGSLIGAASERDANNQAAATADRNRQIAAENADRTLMVAQDELAASGQETRQLIGEQEAVQSGSGLNMNSRSFIQTRAAARELGLIDLRNINEAAQIRAQAYRNEGDAYAAEAIASRKAADTSTLKGFLNATSSIIGGAGSLVRAAPTRRTSTMSVPSPVYV